MRAIWFEIKKNKPRCNARRFVLQTGCSRCTRYIIRHFRYTVIQIRIGRYILPTEDQSAQDKSFLGGVVTSISSNSDLNNYTQTGLYLAPTVTVGRTVVNSPVGIAFVLKVLNVNSFVFQILIASVSRGFYLRRYQASNSSWSSWYQLEGTELTT